MGWETHPEQTDNNTSRVLKQVQITRETDREKCEILVKATKKLHSVTPYLNWKLDRSWECAMHPKFLCEEELGAPIVCAELGTSRYMYLKNCVVTYMAVSHCYKSAIMIQKLVLTFDYWKQLNFA